MKPIAAELRSVNRVAETNAEIDQLWNELAEMHETGRITDAQMRRLVIAEAELEDTPASASWIMRDLICRALRRAVREPGSIGVDPDWGRTYECPSCLDTRLETRDGGRRPCQRCNPRGFELWRDHWRIPGHACDECRGPRGKRKTLVEERLDESAEAAQDRQERLLDDLA